MKKPPENKRVNIRKDVLRDQFYRDINPEIAAPLREILNKHKISEKNNAEKAKNTGVYYESSFNK